MKTKLLRELVELQREQVAALQTANAYLMAIADGGIPPTGIRSSSEPISRQATAPVDAFIVSENEIESGYWMSRKEAWMYLHVVRSTLEGMIRSGELRAYHKKGDERKKRPRVWLKRLDVEALYHTYTLRKGKEKK